MRWYGRGPHESYADRWSGAALGLYEGSLASQYHAYPRPQESGNKMDVRWFALGGAGKPGFTVRGAQPLAFNALPFSYEDLYLRKRGSWSSADIVARGDTSVLIDLAQAGVGGDTGWDQHARAHVPYRVPLAPASYRFTVTPELRARWR